MTWFHLRAELRTRWLTWLAVAMVVGLVGGVVIGTLAGARRTATAHDRMLADTEAWDVLVNPNDGTASALDTDSLEGLPGVDDVGPVDGGFFAVLDPDGNPNVALTLAQRGPEVLVDFARLNITDGRTFDPAAADELMISDGLAAELGVGVGDPVDVGVIDPAAFEEWETSEADGPPPIEVVPLTVVGIGVAPDDVVADDAFTYETAWLTVAFVEEYDAAAEFSGIPVRLEDSIDVNEFQLAVRGLVPDEAIEFQTMESVSDTVERGTRPHLIALVAFAAVLGLAGTVVCGQLVARQLDSLRRDAPRLLAIGLDHRWLRRAALVRASAIVVVATAVALAVAVAISPAFPVGVSRRAEVDPGVDVDLAVVLPGLALLALTLMGWSLLSWRRAPGRPETATAQDSTSPARPFALPGVASTLGVRAAVTRPAGGRGGSRPAIAGLAVAVAAVTAVVTFGANLERFVSSPVAFGFPWDVLVSPPGETFTDTEIEARLTEDPSIRTSVLSVDQLYLEGRRTPAVGIDTGASGVGLTIVEGRAPTSPTEIALGGRTMDRLGVGIGNQVTAGEGDVARSLDVVGQAVFPGIGTYPGADRTELGKGALLHPTTLRELGSLFDFAYLAVTADDPASLDAGLDRALAGYESEIEEGNLEIFREVPRPADVQSLDQVRSTPEAVAGVLAILAALALAATLVSGVRARRRELSLLKTFGFSSRQVGSTVLWQSGVTAALAVVVGLPLGVVMGRASWSALAVTMGVDTSASIPSSLLVVPPAVLLVAALVAIAPGILAARARPSVALRND